jgi:hypothetical protein
MGRKSYVIHFIDEFGEAVTSITSVTVNIAGGSTATIYTTPARTTEKTNPIVSGLSDGTIEFYYNGATCDLVITDGTTTRTMSGITPTDHSIQWPSHMADES